MPLLLWVCPRQEGLASNTPSTAESVVVTVIIIIIMIDIGFAVDCYHHHHLAKLGCIVEMHQPHNVKCRCMA